MTTYRVHARRGDDGWWSIDFPDVPYVYSQARRLESVEAAARDALALRFGVAPDTVELAVDVELPDAVRRVVDDSIRIRREAEAKAREAQAVLRVAADVLVDGLGLTVRDAGRLLQVSPQRVSQVAALGVPEAPAAGGLIDLITALDKSVEATRATRQRAQANRDVPSRSAARAVRSRADVLRAAAESTQKPARARRAG